MDQTKNQKQQQSKDKKIEDIAKKILKKHKKAFEVLAHD